MEIVNRLCYIISLQIYCTISVKVFIVSLTFVMRSFLVPVIGDWCKWIQFSISSITNHIYKTFGEVITINVKY